MDSRTKYLKMKKLPLEIEKIIDVMIVMMRRNNFAFNMEI
jgi:hypothetical protein